jgi:hypothetical protein
MAMSGPMGSTSSRSVPSAPDHCDAPANPPRALAPAGRGSSSTSTALHRLCHRRARGSETGRAGRLQNLARRDVGGHLGAEALDDRQPSVSARSAHRASSRGYDRGTSGNARASTGGTSSWDDYGGLRRERVRAGPGLPSPPAFDFSRNDGVRGSSPRVGFPLFMRLPGTLFRLRVRSLTHTQRTNASSLTRAAWTLPCSRWP